MIKYHIIPNHDKLQLEIILRKISDYLITFTGDIEVKYLDKNNLTISYVNASFTANCQIKKDKLILETFDDDTVTINLIKNIANNAGFRIYNTLGYFLPNDPQILDISSIGIDKRVFNILKSAGLSPIFQYRDSLIFFCAGKDKKICLTNRHYLDFLINNPSEKTDPKELSCLVAPDIATFIAMIDRGLINPIFQKNKEGAKIINHGGFDVFKPAKDEILQVANFRLDRKKQQFVQEATTDKIMDKNYISLKVGQDYNYRRKNKKIYKFLNISAFYN